MPWRTISLDTGPASTSTIAVTVTHVAELADNLPHSTLVKPLHDPSVLLEEEGQGAQAKLCLDEQLSVLLPRIHKLDDMGTRLSGEVTENVHFLEMSQAVFDAIKHAPGFLDREESLAVSFLHLDDCGERALTERLEGDESLFEDVLLGLDGGLGRVGLAMVQRAVEFGGGESGEGEAGHDPSGAGSAAGERAEGRWV
jgi:hypothetical protein